MKSAPLGTTGCEVSRIALATCAITGRPGGSAMSPYDGQAILRTAWENGINFFLTCEDDVEHMAEECIAAALGDVRDQIVIAKRLGPEHQHPREILRAVEESLRALGTDRLDLVLLDRRHPHLEPREILPTLAKLREEKKIRGFGVSRYDGAMLSAALRLPTPPVVVAADYNLLFRGVEIELEAVCRKARLPLIATSPLLLGLLAGRYDPEGELPPHVARLPHFQLAPSGGRGSRRESLRQTVVTALREIRRIAGELGEPVGDVALSWLLSRAFVAAVAVSASSTIQVRRNARAGSLVLPPAVCEELAKVTRPVLELLGGGVDLWAPVADR
ncbi:MAG: aldo/keto reductase [Kiritimatiellae bacterium]|nr:aldo/keto reductase [Kiritimatiellia bacterium]